MNAYVDLYLANEILGLMMGHYFRNGCDRDSKVQQTLLADRKLFFKNDSATIDKILNVYAPMVRDDNYTL